MEADEKLSEFKARHPALKFEKSELIKKGGRHRRNYHFSCKKKHHIVMRSDQLIDFTSCSDCRKENESIKKYEKFRKIIHGKRGEIIQKVDSYLFKTSTKVLVKCKSNHEWKTTLDVQSREKDHWCPYCANVVSHTIEDVRKVAQKNGGNCLSVKYLGKHEKYKFMCDRGHTWKATYNSIDRGTWCPDCSVGKIESLVREYLDSALNVKLVKCRPGWLKTKDGKKLELDGLDEKKKIAFEYQGEHHSCDEFRYKGTKKISREEVVRRDKFKVRFCQEMGIKLIVIDLIENRINPDDEIKNKIVNECRRLEIKIVNPIESIYIDRKSLSRLRENQMQDLALKKNGKFLDENYISSTHKHNWECELGHKFPATPGNVSQGKWCRKCAFKKIIDNKRIGLDEFEKIARQKGGRCLSTKYLKSRVKLKFICKNKHEFEKTGEQVRKKNQWCPDCEN